MHTPIPSLLLSKFTLCVDTAMSTEGDFTHSGSGSFVVEVLGPFEWVSVLVSDRYTAPVDATEAAVLAVDAYHEFEGSQVPNTACFGGPFYHVEVAQVSGGIATRAESVRGIVRWSDDDQDWTFTPSND